MPNNVFPIWLLGHIFRWKKMCIQSRNPNIRALCGSGGEPLGMQTGKTIAANGQRGKPWLRWPHGSFLSPVTGHSLPLCPPPPTGISDRWPYEHRGKVFPIDNTHCHMLLLPPASSSQGPLMAGCAGQSEVSGAPSEDTEVLKNCLIVAWVLCVKTLALTAQSHLPLAHCTWFCFSEPCSLWEVKERFHLSPEMSAWQAVQL